MAVHAQRESVTYRDAKGNTGRVSFFVDGGTSANAASTAAGTVITAMNALTNAVLQSAVGPSLVVQQEVVYGTNATFASVEDKAVFTFQTATGDLHRFQIPAPISSIFLADGETVDPANTAVVTFVSAVIANCLSRNNQVLGFGAFGVRQRRKIRRKLSIFTKNPALSGPDE